MDTNVPPDQEHSVDMQFNDVTQPAVVRDVSPQPVHAQPITVNGRKSIQPVSPDMIAENEAQSRIQQAPTVIPDQKPAEATAATSTIVPNMPFNMPAQRPVQDSTPTGNVTGTVSQSDHPQNGAGTTAEKGMPMTFRYGYVLGATIFWNQVVVEILLAVAFYILNLVLFKTITASTSSLLVTVGLLHYVAEYLVALYIPYRILRSEGIKDPIWVTFFGFAVQSIMLFAGLEILNISILGLVLHHALTYALVHSGGSGFALTTIITYVGYLIISYFLTRLSWGVAFSLFGKIKSAILIRLIGITIIACTIGGIIYRY